MSKNRTMAAKNAKLRRMTMQEKNHLANNRSATALRFNEWFAPADSFNTEYGQNWESAHQTTREILHNFKEYIAELSVMSPCRKILPRISLASYKVLKQGFLYEVRESDYEIASQELVDAIVGLGELLT